MKSYKNLLLTAAFGLMLAACGDDSSSSAPDDKTTSSGDKYLLSFMMDNSQFVGTAALSDDQSEVVKDFIEAPNAGGVAYFDGSVYVLATDDAINSTLSRYELDKDGNMPEKASATAKFQGTRAIMMKFVDENKLYVEQAMGDAITAIDPKTLKTTATIDLSEYVDTESGAMSTIPGSAVIRDGKMFVSLNQFVDFTNMIAGPRGSVAIIDVKTDKVEKVIYEEQTAALGGMDDMTKRAISISTPTPPTASSKVIRKAGYA